MNNKLQIIETPEYYLAVSEEEIKESNCGLITSAVMTYEQMIKEWGEPLGRKIIAYKPKNNAPTLGLPLLPEIVVEDEVEKLAVNYAGNRKLGAGHGYPSFEACLLEKGFIEGYKSATKVYSEEDLKKAYNKGFSEGVIKGTCSMVYKHESFEEYIQSLKQSKTTPKWFIAETVCDQCLDDETVDSCYCNFGNYKTVLKNTTINGKTYLVGTYLN